MFSLLKINLNLKMPAMSSLAWNPRESVALPLILLCPLVLFVCMSFADLGYTDISYGIFAWFLSGCAFMTCLYLRDWEMSRFGFVSVISMLALLVFSLANYENSDVKNALYMSLEMWMLAMVFYYYRERIHIVVIACAVYLSFCVYVNFIHVMLHPELWLVSEEKSVGGYLLGNNYNGMGFRFIMAIAFSMLCLRYSWKWIFNLVFVVALSVVPLVLTGSKTSLSGILMLVFVSLLPSVRLQRLIANCAIVGFVLFQVFVVFSGKGLEDNELAVYIVEDILDKDITFTYRTYLWDMSMEKIAESPLWGFGFLSNEWYDSNIKIPYGTGPCNFVLAIMLNGGIILITMLTALVAMTLRRLSQYDDRGSVLLRMSIACILVMHLMEMQSYVFIYFLLTLGYYYPYIRTSSYPRKHDINDKNNS